MKRKDQKQRRSDCPVNFAVEALGDKWSLVILRDMMFWGKRTYGEFLKSDERIATNILADRLTYLIDEGLITKSRNEADKRKDVYTVTEKAIDLVPMLIEMIVWSAGREEFQKMDHSNATPEQFRFVEEAATTRDKAKLVEKVKDTVRQGGCVFQGVERPIS